MKSYQLHGLEFQLPEAYQPSETMITLRADAPDPGLPVMGRQLKVNPNLIIHRRPAPKDRAVEMIAGEMMAEMAASIADMENLTTEAFDFRDNVPGIIIGFDFGAGQHARLRQFHALRVDDGTLTTSTLTVDAQTLNDSNKAEYLAILASPTPNGTSISGAS